MSEAARKLAEEYRDGCVVHGVDVEKLARCFDWLLSRIREDHWPKLSCGDREAREFVSLFATGGKYGPDVKPTFYRIDNGHEANTSVTLPGGRKVHVTNEVFDAILKYGHELKGEA